MAGKQIPEMNYLMSLVERKYRKAVKTSTDFSTPACPAARQGGAAIGANPGKIAGPRLSAPFSMPSSCAFPNDPIPEMYLDLMASNLSAWAADIFPDAPDKVLRSDDNSESRAFKALISTFSPASTLILSPRQRSQIASYLSNALSKPSFCGEAAAGRQSPATKARHKRICPRRFRIGFI